MCDRSEKSKEIQLTPEMVARAVTALADYDESLFDNTTNAIVALKAGLDDQIIPSKTNLDYIITEFGDGNGGVRNILSEEPLLISK